jgi:hypothetical protein
VTISNLVLLFNSETGLDPGVTNRNRSTHLVELDVRKPLVVTIPRRRKELRLVNLV